MGGSVRSSNCVSQTEVFKGILMSFALLLMFLFMIYIDPAYLAPGLNVDRAIQLVGISGMVILMVRKLVSQEKLQFQWPESYLMLGLIGAAGLSCFAAFSHN